MCLPGGWEGSIFSTQYLSKIVSGHYNRVMDKKGFSGYTTGSQPRVAGKQGKRGNFWKKVNVALGAGKGLNVKYENILTFWPHIVRSPHEARPWSRDYIYRPIENHVAPRSPIYEQKVPHIVYLIYRRGRLGATSLLHDSGTNRSSDAWAPFGLRILWVKTSEYQLV